jgi:adenosylcobinamide-phosphate guanylyltransferase
MTVTALVMAGGKGTRLKLDTEKPLLQIGETAVVELVLAALKNAKKVDDIVVAVSRNTPKTAEYLKHLPIKTIETPGKEYVTDMGFAVRTLGLQTVLALAADLPLLTSTVVDDVVTRFFECKKPALAVAVPQETRKNLGIGAGYGFDWQGQQVEYAGINVLDGAKIDDPEIEQEIYVLDRVEVAVNINTVDEMQIAQKEFTKFTKTKTPA